MLASKIACAGIALALVMSGIVIQNFPRRTIHTVGFDSNQQGVAAIDQTEIKKVQDTLRQKGHYLGKVDGVFGLQTRDSVRAYQKAENLPVTGKLDAQTAGQLGVRPEVREQTGHEAMKGKPSAYISWAKGSERTSKAQPKAVRTIAAPGDSRGDREKTLQADKQNHPE